MIMLVTMKLNVVLLFVTLMIVLITANQVASQYSRPQVQNSHLDLNGASEGSLQPQECGPRCTMRCSATQYKKACMSFCQKCCAKCLCVPPGTYGNKQLCPCYNSWKTKRGGPKCP